MISFLSDEKKRERNTVCSSHVSIHAVTAITRSPPLLHPSAKGQLPPSTPDHGLNQRHRHLLSPLDILILTVSGHMEENDGAGIGRIAVPILDEGGVVYEVAEVGAGISGRAKVFGLWLVGGERC